MFDSITNHRSTVRACIATLALLAACADSTTKPFSATESASRASLNADADVGAVFVTTNAASGNAVVAFARGSDGALTPSGSFATGGLGIGGTIDPLASQSALALSDDNRRLYVVNAASNSVSTFAVSGAALTLLGTVPSAGTRPVSVTISRGRLFVLNAASNSIAELALRADGTPVQSPVATATLSSPSSGASTISVSPDGHFVVVTERAANTLDVFTVAPDGSLSAPATTHSNGGTPFGFEFTPRGQAIVSEAAGAAPNGAVSSYDLNADGSLSVVSRSMSTQQAATCWLVVSKDGRLAFAVNSGSGSIAAFGIGADGSLDLLSADGRTGVTGAGTAPIDLGLSRNGQFLYVLNAAAGTVGGFSVGRDGSLASISGATGLAPASGLQGLAAY
ncbi:MAG: lactonase family protein [Gemmatimonadaceae bacterium]